MAKKRGLGECCVNKIIYNSIVGVPPDIDPPSSGFDWYVYELIIDTTGFGAANSIEGITIDGILYPNDGMNGIGGNVSTGEKIGTSLHFATFLAGLQDGTNGGGYGFNDHAAFNLSYGFFILPTLHDISITYDENIVGQPLKTHSFVSYGINNDSINSCATISGDPAAQIIMGYRVTAPLNTGGTTTIQLDTLSFSCPMNIDIVANDLYLNLLSVMWDMIDPGLAGPYAEASTSVVDGGNYDFTLLNNFGVITAIVTDQATVPLTSC